MDSLTEAKNPKINIPGYNLFIIHKRGYVCMFEKECYLHVNVTEINIGENQNFYLHLQIF